ncbi:DNA polymerase III subunit [Reichenbachiella versicolor]|uniref:DNA polymerase III subunit n=1 Tax=Reichenbachiella versicolor TaxID=1821036 RepID=UPI000D6E77AC|nr:DNA polymerase III subunit delta' [Reichenbachiella versicolor]
MRFADIPGLSDSKYLLTQAVKNNHVAHAQLFYGKPGSGNMAIALAFATYLNCTDKQENDSCGKCPSCVKMDKLVHPDLQFVFPVSATKGISGKNVVSSSYLNEWREFLIANPFGSLEDWSGHYGAENKQANISKEESRNIVKSMTMTSFEGEYKVLIIWLPENMHSTAANGILKILEEPPAKTIFIMVSCDYERLLTTILSRCQLFKIPNFSTEDIETYLTKTHNLLPERAKTIAALSEGSIRTAIENIDESENDDHAIFRDWMRQCWTKDFIKINQTNDIFFKMSKTAQKLFLQYAINMLRHALVHSVWPEESEKLNSDEQGFVANFGKALNEQKIEVISSEINTALYHIERNANIRILFLDLSIRIGQAMTA